MSKTDPGGEAWMLLIRLLRPEQSLLLDRWSEFGLSSSPRRSSLFTRAEADRDYGVSRENAALP